MVWTFLPLSNGGFTLIDAADRPRVLEHNWYRAKKGYAVCDARREGRRIGYLHRFLLGLRPGDKRQADHINRDKLDNRRCNLRAVTHAQNRQNVPAQRGSTSLHRGVCWDAEHGKWIASATLDGRHRKIGRFDSEGAAAEAIAKFRSEHMPFAEAQ